MKDKRIAILFLTIFIDLLGFGIIIPILPNLAKEFASESNLSIQPDIAVGLVAAVFSVIQFLFAPIFGSISDRLGRRPIILGSILVNAIGYVMFGFASSFALLIISRIVSGFGSANISAAQAYIADITSPEERAKKMGIIGAAFGLGFVFGPPIGGWLYDWGINSVALEPILNSGNAADMKRQLAEGMALKRSVGLEYVGIFSAILCLINLVLAWKYLPESIQEKSGVKRKPSETFKGMITVWSVEIVGELLLINFIYIAAFSMMQINASVLWKEHYGLSPKAIGNIFGIIGIFSAVVQGGLIGVFQKKFGLKRMLLWGAPLCAIGLSIIPLPSKEWFYPVQILAIFFLAMGNGFLMPSINSLVSMHSPAGSQGKMMGILQSMGSLARAVGPLFSGVLYAQYFALPYLMGGFLMLIVFILALMLNAKLAKNTP